MDELASFLRVPKGLVKKNGAAVFSTKKSWLKKSISLIKC